MMKTGLQCYGHMRLDLTSHATVEGKSTDRKAVTPLIPTMCNTLLNTLTHLWCGVTLLARISVNLLFFQRMSKFTKFTCLASLGIISPHTLNNLPLSLATSRHLQSVKDLPSIKCKLNIFFHLNSSIYI